MNHLSPAAPIELPTARRSRPHPLRLEALLLALAAAPACGEDGASSDPTSSLDRPNDADADAQDDPSTSSDAEPGSGSGGEPGSGPTSGDPSDSGDAPDGSDSSGAPDEPGAFDDEFDGDEDHLVSGGPWQRLFPEQAGSMLEGGHPGFLSITASPESVDNSWYFEHHGAALVKEVAGNFAIMTSLTTTSTQGGAAEPAGIFNSGGLLIRDVLAAEADENWMTFNVGHQASAYGRELKKTIASGSNYFLNAQAQNTEHLLVCRLGAQFRFYHWDEVAGAWEAERFDNQVATDQGPATTQVNDLYDPVRNPELDLPGPGESIELVFEFPSLSPTVQVGVMINSWGAPHDVTSEFDYIRMGSSIPRSPADCTAELVPS